MTGQVIKLFVLFTIALLFNLIHCEESELFEDLEAREPALSEKLAQSARYQWDNLISANLNGYYSTLVYFADQNALNLPLGFNTTKPTTIAILGHFAIILSGIYLLSLLPPGALDSLIPRVPFLNKGNRHYRRRHRNRHRKQPAYDYYDYNEYEDDYEYGFRHGPPRDHHRRLLRHGPPLFNRRMSEGKYHEVKNTKTSTAENMEFGDKNGFMNEGSAHHRNIVKRQANSANPWYVDLMNFAMGPFNRFSRSYAQLYDHYGDFWRFRLSSLVGTDEKKDSVGLRVPPPPNLIDNIKHMNRGIDGVLSRLITGVQRVAGVPSGPQTRSFNPAQRRNSQGNRRQRRRHGSQRSRHQQENVGPPPAVPEDHVEVVQALHED